MRLIQPIFASYSTRPTGLGDNNKIYNDIVPTLNVLIKGDAGVIKQTNTD